MKTSVKIHRIYCLIFPVLLSINTIAQTPIVSIIADANPGPITLHGLNKLIKVLEAKHISFERVNSIEDAKGQKLLVIGLAYGNGPAASLLKPAHAVAETSEALTIQNRLLGKK